MASAADRPSDLATGPRVMAAGASMGDVLGTSSVANASSTMATIYS